MRAGLKLRPFDSGIHDPDHTSTCGTREWVARAFTCVEDIGYIGLGVLLTASGVVLLGHTVFTFVNDLAHAMLPSAVVGLLDRLLLVLMIIELLYTVQVSFREHAIIPEPFIIA